MTYTTEIREGDYVRSYDFEGVNDCYVEGVVQAIGVAGLFHVNGDENVPGNCYAILVEHVVWNGHLDPKTEPFLIYPPINGLEKSTGGVTSFVVKILDRDSLTELTRMFG